MASVQKYLQSEWPRAVQYISYCTFDIAPYKNPKIIEVKQAEKKRKINKQTKIVLKDI